MFPQPTRPAYCYCFHITEENEDAEVEGLERRAGWAPCTPPLHGTCPQGAGIGLGAVPPQAVNQQLLDERQGEREGTVR